MNVKEVDLIQLSQIISELRDNSICWECCKCYTTPKTAKCGHTLCQGCWIGRQMCPICVKRIERRDLKHNEPLDIKTKHIIEITAIFENTFKIQLDEFLMDPSDSLNDSKKIVKDWLSSSQNHFSVPPQSSDRSPQESQSIANPLELSSNQVQIHTNSRRTTKSPEKVLHVAIPQDDWDKIEVMPDSTELDKNKENVIGTDIETYNIINDEYTVNHPRRSSRKREIQTDLCKQKEPSVEKQSSKDNTYESDKKSNTARQNWNNVKKMRKEFGKLNKKNRNKLNVSIEMAKKNQKIVQKNIHINKVPSFVYDIDENTPDINEKKTKDLNEQHNVVKDINNETNLENCKNNSEAKNEKITNIIIQKTNQNKSRQHFIDSTNHQQTIAVNDETELNAQYGNMNKHNKIQTIEGVTVPFYKKGPLYQNIMGQGRSNETTTVKKSTQNFNTSTPTNDDINITIKVGNSVISNITIKKNTVDVKNTRECEAQTSLCLQELDVNKPAESVHQLHAQNIVINVNNEQSVTVNSQPQTEHSINKVVASLNQQSEKTKKNTDSAETATAQFEITESEEKELSKVMEHIEIDEKINSTSNDDQKGNKSHHTPQKSASHQNDLDYLNDIDLFDSESMKGQTLKSNKNAPSEILVCTASTKNRTQKRTEKRDRDLCDENRLPNSKKAKLGNDNVGTVEEVIELNKSTCNPIGSEPLNYESILGKVFANIDADIEDKSQSQDILKNTFTMNNDKVAMDSENLEKNTSAESSQHVVMSEVNEIDCSVVLNEANQKNSENVFSSCGDKNVDNEQLPINSKMAPNISQTNVDEFLTPVVHNEGQEENNMVMDTDIVSDDSDKSVVEETPQKISSFTKAKSKSNDKVTEAHSSQRLQSDRKSVTKSISSHVPTVDLTDTSKRSSNEVTAITVATAKPVETPHNLSKFVNQISHKSTPMTKKSLNFDGTDEIDPEQTLCPSNEVAKTTQEKEFLRKAFETTMVPEKTVTLRNNKIDKKFCVAGTCLTPSELHKVKLLCSRNKWTYTDKYSSELTHLVVAVDDENKAQRSVKFMCALASSKWIISYEWVQECLRTNSVVKEEPYEVLDSSGEPSPRRSRIATRKLFEGMSFYCMAPFSILAVELLTELLEAAGGRVVQKCADIVVSERTARPALLLAEPENTQEDKYVYLAMDQSVVPVNYEWALNSIGTYCLVSLRDQLLCPASLLHKVTEKWPAQLMAHDDDSQ